MPMRQQTFARKLILDAFTRERMTMTSDDLEELRVEYQIGKNAFARARAELASLGWIRMEHDCDDDGDPAALWSVVIDRLEGRGTAHLRRHDGSTNAKANSSETRCSGIAKASWTKG